MVGSDAWIAQLFIQTAIFGLSLSVVGLTIKGFMHLSDDRKRIQHILPDGQLLTQAIVGVGIALVIINSLAAIFAIPQSMYIMRSELPQRFRKRFPDKFTIKSMSILAFVMAPINIAQTCITATRSAHATSSFFLDPLFLQALLPASGESPKYKDYDIVVDYTIISWIVWIAMLIGIGVEVRKDKDHYSEKPQGSEQDSKPKFPNQATTNPVDICIGGSTVCCG